MNQHYPRSASFQVCYFQRRSKNSRTSSSKSSSSSKPELSNTPFPNALLLPFLAGRKMDASASVLTPLNAKHGRSRFPTSCLEWTSVWTCSATPNYLQLWTPTMVIGKFRLHPKIVIKLHPFATQAFISTCECPLD